MDRSFYPDGNLPLFYLAKVRSSPVQNGFDFLFCSVVPQYSLVSGLFWAPVTASGPHGYPSPLDSHPFYDLLFLSGFQICRIAPHPLSLVGEFCNCTKLFSVDSESLRMIQKERIKVLNQKEMKKGAYVLYWMQISQRTEYNHALEYAIIRANELKQPLLVFFGITDHFPEANERHYAFMLEGLQEVKQSLGKRGIRVILLHQPLDRGAVQIAKKASLVIVDRGYLSIQRQWRENVANRIDCPFIQVESDVVVPIEEVSNKEEYAAATIRSKMHRKLDHFMVPLKQRDPDIDSLSLKVESFRIDKMDQALSKLRIDRSVKKVPFFRGGMKEASKHLEVFLEGKLDRFPELRNDPTLDYLSQMSPYLHFGQISPLWIALKVKQTQSTGIEAFLEELIIRRELSMNFVFYNEKYDSYESIPE